MVSLSVTVPLAVPAQKAWAALVDWGSHGRWIPATRSTVLEGDGGVGSVFEAVSGYKPLALVDRMRVTVLDAASMSAEVEKIGPVLGGSAGFTIRANGDAECAIEWHEAVTVPLLPSFLAPLAAVVGKVAFAMSLRRLPRAL